MRGRLVRKALERSQQLDAAGKTAEATVVLERAAKWGGKQGAEALFQLGNRALAADDAVVAEELLTRAAARQPENLAWQLQAAIAELRVGKNEESLARLSILAEREYAPGRVAFRMAQNYRALRRMAEARERFQFATELRPKEKIFRRRFADLLRKQGRRWQEVELYRVGIEVDPSDAEARLRLADALEALAEDAEAVEHWQAAAELDGAPQTYYRLGRARERLGDAVQAQEAFQRAIELDTELGAARFGVGVFAEAAGNWPEAAQHFDEKTRAGDSEAELYFKLGFAQDRCFRWDEAAEAYRQAVAGAPENGLYRYRLGYALERKGRWIEAAASYAVAADRSTDDNRSVSLFRQAHCLLRAQRLEQAVTAFLASVSESELFASDAPRSRAWATQGDQQQAAGDFAAAASSYSWAIDNSPEHAPALMMMQAEALRSSGDLEAAANVLADSRVIKGPAPFGATEFEITGDKPIAELFAVFVSERALRPDVVLFDSDGDALKETFQAMRSDARTASRRFVWVTEDESTPSWAADLDIVLAPRESFRYRMLLATAGQIVSDRTLPTYYVRRDGQQYAQVVSRSDAHEAGESPLAHTVRARALLQATLLWAQDESTLRSCLDEHQITHLYAGSATTSPLLEALCGAHVAEPPIGNSLPTILFSQGLLPNGISSSFIHLARSLDPNKVNSAVIMPSVLVKYDEGRLGNLSRLPQEIAVLGSMEGACVTGDERWARTLARQENAFTSAQHEQAYGSYYRREARRLLGVKKFEAVVDFEGYSVHKLSMMAFMEPRPDHSLLYLHSAMMRERHTRFPYLQLNFEMYHRFDRLVSVSRAVGRENSASLLPLYPDLADRFAHCDNPIDPEPFKDAPSTPDPDIAAFCAPGATVFVNAGRLSPEKGQEQLIEAFGGVYRDHPSTRLLLLGEGPIRTVLERKIAELGLTDVIMLAGWRPDIHAQLSAADCFVLSSEYEGQGMVVIEALTVGLPVISTEIPAVTEILTPDTGLLVEHSVSGLEQGMLEFLRNQWAPVRFDAAAYHRQALRQFEDCLGLEVFELSD